MEWFCIFFLMVMCNYEAICDDKVTSSYNYIISTLHKQDSKIFNLRNVAKTLFSNTANIDRIQLTRFYHKDGLSETKLTIAEASSFMLCDDKTGNYTEDITKFFCIKENNFDLYATKNYKPETKIGKSVELTFDVLVNDTQNSITSNKEMLIILEIKSPCQIQELKQNEILGPKSKKITDRNVRTVQIDFDIDKDLRDNEDDILFLSSIEIQNLPAQIYRIEIFLANLTRIFTSYLNVLDKGKYVVKINQKIDKNQKKYSVTFFNDDDQKYYISIQSSMKIDLYYHGIKDFCEDSKQINAYLNWLQYVDKMQNEEKNSCVNDRWKKTFQECIDGATVEVTTSSNEATYNGEINLVCSSKFMFLKHQYVWYFTEQESGHKKLLDVSEDNSMALSQLNYDSIGEYTCHVIVLEIFNKSMNATNSFNLVFGDVVSGSLKFSFPSLLYKKDYDDELSTAHQDVKISTELAIQAILSGYDLGADNPKFYASNFKNNTGHLQVSGKLLMRNTIGNFDRLNWLTSVQKEIIENKNEFNQPVDEIRVIDPEICIEATFSGINAEYNFTVSSIQINNTASVPCPNNNTKYASLSCVGGSDGNAVWRMFNDSQCKQVVPVTKPKALATKIIELDKENITDENMRNSSQKLKGYSEEMLVDGTSEEVALIGNTMRKYTNAMSKDADVANDVYDAVDNMLSVNKSIMEESEIKNGTASILLDLIANASATLAENKTLKVQRKRFALFGKPLNISRFNGTSFLLSNDNNTMTVEEKNETITAAQTLAQVYLPPTILKNKRQGSFVFLAIGYEPDNNLFVENKKKIKNGGTLSVNTAVISFQVKGEAIRNLDDPIQLHFNITNTSVKDNDKLCTFWEVEAKEWSENGCWFHAYNESTGHHICHCDHLTNFAMLFNSVAPSNAKHREILSIITYVGLSLSLLGAAITFIVHALFPPLRESIPPKLLMNLCCAVFALSVIFLSGAENNNYSKTECGIIAGFIQYIFLVTFFWSAIEAFHSARGLVFPMKTEISKFLLKAMLVGWLVPALFPLIGGLSMPDDYGEFGEEKSCVVHGNAFYLFQLLPTITILVGNGVGLVAIMYSLQTTTSKYSANSIRMKDRLRIITAFMILFGFTWIFGLLVINNDIIVFQYAFCILSTLQGVYIFLFYCIRNPKIRQFLRALSKGRYVKDLDTLNSISNDTYIRKRTKTMETTVSNMSLSESNRYSIKSSSAVT